MFETGAFLLNEKGNIDRLRTDDGAEYRIESTLSVEAANNANTAAEAAKEQAAKSTEAETAREAAETKRAQDETARVDAETKRAAAEQERAAQQVKNNADQAANNAAAQGLQVVKLNEGQFDPDTLMPTVSGEVGKLYFVPIPSQAMSALAALVDVPAGDGQDNYLEWMSIDGKWERVGMSNATLVSLTTDEIDRIVAGEQVTSESVLDGTKLSYYMTKIKTAFAAFAHKHVTGDVTGLDTALGDKATKAELKTVQDSLPHRLWSGSRGVGETFTVPGISSYRMLAVKCRNVWVIASVRDDGGFIQGGAVYCSISMANATLNLLLGKSGDQVTVSICSDVNSGMANDVEVNEIVGLLK